MMNVYVKEKMNPFEFVTVIFSIESTIDWLRAKFMYMGCYPGDILHSFTRCFKFVILLVQNALL